MRKSAVSKYLSMIAKRGGEARARTLTAEQRKAIATKASKAAAAARRRKAKERILPSGGSAIGYTPGLEKKRSLCGREA